MQNSDSYQVYMRTIWKKGYKHKKSKRPYNNCLKVWHENSGIPWNKDKKGLHLSPKSEFKKGMIPWNKGMKGLKIGTPKGTKFGDIHRKKLSEVKKKFYRERGNIIGFKKGNKLGWKGGISFEPYSIDWTETLKRVIRERDKYLCKVCNLYGYCVHHIDYDKKNCNLNNLITLCNSCHTRTNHNRNYWKNYFGKEI